MSTRCERSASTTSSILDVNNQCAHLNYTNRVANGLGLFHDAIVEERSLDRVPR